MRNDLERELRHDHAHDALTSPSTPSSAQVGETLGKHTMADYMRRFGFYRSRRSTTRRKRCRQRRAPERRLLPVTSDQVDVGRMAIGQDKLAVTPMQMAMVVAAIANGGS